MAQDITRYYNGQPIESRTWSIKRRHFQWPWTTQNPDFNVTPLLNAEYLRNNPRYRLSYSEILMGILRFSQELSFLMTLSDWNDAVSKKTYWNSIHNIWKICSFVTETWLANLATQTELLNYHLTSFKRCSMFECNNFLPHDAMHAWPMLSCGVCVSLCVSLCVSVCLLCSYILSKGINISSKLFSP